MVKKLNLALQLISHPISIPRAYRKTFMEALLRICQLKNKQDKKIAPMRHLAEWIWVGFQLAKTTDNQDSISEESIETELYVLIREKEEEISNSTNQKKNVPLTRNQKQRK